MELFKTKILIISKTPAGSAAETRMRNICDEIKRLGSQAILVDDIIEGYKNLSDTIDTSAVLIDFDSEYEKAKTDKYAHLLLPQDSTIFDHKLVTYGKYISHQTSKFPLYRMEEKGYSLLVPNYYPKEKIDQLKKIMDMQQFIAFVEEEKLKFIFSPLYIINNLRKINKHVLIFLYTKKLVIERIPLSILEQIEAYFWKNEETYTFVAKRIVASSKDYLDFILPPFFKALFLYVKQGKYSWHTPGHFSGAAFLRSPPGRIFFDFYGENMFLADLSISVAELGGLLSHNGPIGEAEKYAAKVFGAEYTYFVTNGTSTSNKMILGGTCIEKDVVILDRNSHKSSMQAIMTSNLRPLYLNPGRNKYGIIGPNPMKQFTLEHLKNKLKKYPYFEDNEELNNLKLLILTQSTYDGIVYNTQMIEELAEKCGIKNLLFDEAWFAYAHFHYFYQNWHAMNKKFEDKEVYAEVKDKISKEEPFSGNIFATQSTHKTLASLSQSSMLHVRNTKDPFFFERFNNYFQVNTSTSPQYSLLASLDISTAIMDLSGFSIIDDVLEEVIYFRRSISRMQNNYTSSGRGWFFSCWQPPNILSVSEEKIYEPEFWTLEESSETSWHGFKNVGKNEYLLDPLKVTILTVDEKNHVEIPACVVSKFLSMNGIIMEKVGYYTMLILFSIGSRRGKSATLITALTQFKNYYDDNVDLKDIFKMDKNLSYGDMGLRDFCELMNPKVKKMQEMENESYNGELPEIVCLPFKANCALVNNEIEWVEVEKLEGRVSAVLIVNYPPGIPTIMPGEKFNKNMTELIIALAYFENEFPGYEYEVHGLISKNDKFYVPCLKQ